MLTTCVKTETEGARLNLDLRGPGSKVSTVSPPFPKDVQGCFYYISGDGEVTIEIANPGEETVASYRFYVDLSSPLQAGKSKRMPLEACPVGFHVDLKKDQRIATEWASDPSSSLESTVYSLYYVYSSGYRGYLLKRFAETSSEALTFKADLEGRYYIVLRPARDVVTLSLVETVTSPRWTREVFWVTVAIAVPAILFAWFLTQVETRKDLDTVGKHALLGICCSFTTLALLWCLVGAYDSRALALMPLLYLFVSCCALSLVIQIYAAYLGRTSPVVVCPRCLKRVAREKTSFCCDRMVTSVSGAWNLAPAAFGLVSFLGYSSASFSSSLFLGMELPVLPIGSLWAAGAGCLIGGIAVWRVNRRTRRSWSHLASGVILSLLFPLLVSLGVYLDVMGVFEPPREVEVYPGGVERLLVRVNTFPTVPLGVIVTFAVLTAGLSYLLLVQARISMARVEGTSQDRDPRLPGLRSRCHSYLGFGLARSEKLKKRFGCE